MTERCRKCKEKLSGTQKDSLDKGKGVMVLFCPGCDTRHEFRRGRLGNWGLWKY